MESLTPNELLCLIENHAAGKLSYGADDQRIKQLADALVIAKTREANDSKRRAA